jgi:hypothetical protein
MPTPEIEALNFVILGNFNPMIFHPAWFRSAGLIDEDQQAAAIENKIVVIPELARAKFPHVSIEATQHRLMAFTLHPGHFEILRDFVKDIFRVLPHTPVKKLGINLEEHWKYDSEDAWNQFGHKLAPKKTWQSFMNDPGLTSLTMLDKKGDSRERVFTVQISSSERVRPWGVFFQTNYEHTLAAEAGQPSKSGPDLVKGIDEDYSEAVRRGKAAIQHLINES